MSVIAIPRPLLEKLGDEATDALVQVVKQLDESRKEELVTKDSDIDIVILSDDFKGKNIFKRAQLTKEAEIKTIKKFLIPIDILTMTPDEWEKSRPMFS